MNLLHIFENNFDPQHPQTFWDTHLIRNTKEGLCWEKKKISCCPWLGKIWRWIKGEYNLKQITPLLLSLGRKLCEKPGWEKSSDTEIYKQFLESYKIHTVSKRNNNTIFSSAKIDLLSLNSLLETLKKSTSRLILDFSPEKNVSTLDMLSLDLFDQIFSLLTRIELQKIRITCKKWNACISRQPHLLTNLFVEFLTLQELPNQYATVKDLFPMSVDQFVGISYSSPSELSNLHVWSKNGPLLTSQNNVRGWIDKKFVKRVDNNRFWWASYGKSQDANSTLFDLETKSFSYFEQKSHSSWNTFFWNNHIINFNATQKGLEVTKCDMKSRVNDVIFKTEGQPESFMPSQSDNMFLLSILYKDKCEIWIINPFDPLNNILSKVLVKQSKYDRYRFSKIGDFLIFEFSSSKTDAFLLSYFLSPFIKNKEIPELQNKEIPELQNNRKYFMIEQYRNFNSKIAILPVCEIINDEYYFLFLEKNAMITSFNSIKKSVYYLQYINENFFVSVDEDLNIHIWNLQTKKICACSEKEINEKKRLLSLFDELTKLNEAILETKDRFNFEINGKKEFLGINFIANNKVSRSVLFKLNKDSGQIIGSAQINSKNGIHFRKNWIWWQQTNNKIKLARLF